MQGIRPVGKKRRGNSSASSRLPLFFFPVLLIGNSISYFMSEIFKIILSFFHHGDEGEVFVHPVAHDADDFSHREGSEDSADAKTIDVS